MSVATMRLERRKVQNGILGILLVIATEAMFFTGLISAYFVGRAGQGTWPPPGQPRLPIEMTALNTVLLLFSIPPLLKALRKREFDGRSGDAFLILTMLFGSIFLLLQGREWVALLEFGMSATNNVYGAFFYLIVGAHGLHVLVGLAVLTTLILRRAPYADLRVFAYYWYFVVALWPVLYGLVYLL